MVDVHTVSRDVTAVAAGSVPEGGRSGQAAIRIWLLAVAAVVFALVMVGGATRLTESGLSIVEWRVVTGTMPPLSEAAWQTEFEKYKAIPQYQQVNRGMSLADFKTIYWWEWGHRFLGRLVGLVFLVPFLWFLWKGMIGKRLQGRLWLLFGLGGLQGVVGWWMVASGLTERVSVAPYRLGFHLTLACIIFAGLVWTAEGLRAPRRPPAPLPDLPARLRRWALVLVGLVLVQIYLGALVAGLRAGYVYNTWPLIDGAIVPAAERLFFLTPLWLNFFENDLMVQFVHRLFAYALWAATLWHAIDALRAGRDRATGAGPGAVALAAAVTLQAVIGIVTLVHGTPIGLALMHQGMAVVVLAIAVVHASRLRERGAAASTAALAR